jgi:hypothetical protein
MARWATGPFMARWAAGPFMARWAIGGLRALTERPMIRSSA